ncbi:CalY family protein [Brevibacillus ruminantium]|uniref:CalY family protein n=1 Tax=Brevibacillus ruminantium TaxID=2950604 RepID=A0ABY4WGJ5_9BACL|nr:TasA family protein [Brevibacillus ruminantium]USG66290.1 CalY family protein [Brevibacillus ruminantium]
MKWEQVKHWPWKRIALGTAVISSIIISTGFGTYAYFTSSVEESSTFAAGKLEISLGENKARFETDDDRPFLPGVRFSKTLTVQNRSDVPVKYALLAEKEDGDDIVYNQLVVEVRREGEGGELLYHGRVNQLNQANVVIAELPKNDSDQLHFSVYLPESTGNDVQQKSADVTFGFLATQQENGHYFAQGGPVMTFTPQDLNGIKLAETLRLASKEAERDSAKGMTFVLEEGSYDLSSMKLPEKITWKAAPGKEGKVIVRADELQVSNAAFEGIRFEGRGTGLYVGSNVSFSGCTFDGSFDAAIRPKPDLSGEKTLEGLTVKDSVFSGAQEAIVVDQTMKAVFIANNTFQAVNHAVVVASQKESEVQMVGNDFTRVNKYAVDSGGVRVGDGIEGFRETSEVNGDVQKLALHLFKADLYFEDNKY